MFTIAVTAVIIVVVDRLGAVLTILVTSTVLAAAFGKPGKELIDFSLAVISLS